MPRKPQPQKYEYYKQIYKQSIQLHNEYYEKKKRYDYLKRKVPEDSDEIKELNELGGLLNKFGGKLYFKWKTISAEVRVIRSQIKSTIRKQLNDQVINEMKNKN